MKELLFIQVDTVLLIRTEESIVEDEICVNHCSRGVFDPVEIHQSLVFFINSLSRSLNFVIYGGVSIKHPRSFVEPFSKYFPVSS